MKKIVSLIIAAAFMLVGFAAFGGITTAANSSVPSGYAPNDYLKLRAFLETTDSAGVKNGEKLCNEFGVEYDPDDPGTWGNVEEHDGIYGEVCWRLGDDGLRHAEWLYFGWLGLVGELDLSGFDYLKYINISENRITAVDLEGASAIESFVCDGNPIGFINWHNAVENVSIDLSAENGYVNTYYSWKEDFSNYPCAWYAKAWTESDSRFIGWYDADGNCVSSEPEYEICETLVGEDYAGAPTGVHLDLTARFESAVEPTAQPTDAPTAVPTEAPTAVPTDAPTAPPAEPTEAPAEPTEAPAEPTVAPTDAPKPPNTGTIALSAIGIFVAAAGAVVGIRAAKKCRD